MRFNFYSLHKEQWKPFGSPENHHKESKRSERSIGRIINMEVIPEETVQKTWEEVTGFSQGQAKKEMTTMGERQPELLSFMMEFTQDLDEEAQGLAIYMFFVVCRIFEKASAKKIKKVSPQQIITCFESNEELVQSLEGTHERLLERIAETRVLTQPFVMKYVLDTLFEAPEDDDPVELTDEEIGHLFLLFKTVIDVLDQTG
jgi:hypothetical protein